MLTSAAGSAKLKAHLPLGSMPEEPLKAFLEAVKADEGLQEQLKAAGDADAVVAIAKAAGFAITAEDLTRSQAEIEISEEELEGVQGGARMQNYMTSYLYCGTMYCCNPTKLPQGCD